MGVLIGLMSGVGLLTVWLAATDLAPPTTRPGSVEAVASITSMAPQVRSAALSAVGCVAVALLATGLPVAAAMAACLGAALPRLVRRRKAARTLVIRREAWPEVIDSLVSGVRAGMALPEAVASVAVRGPECLRPPFQQFADDYRSSGRFVENPNRVGSTITRKPLHIRGFRAFLCHRETGQNGAEIGLVGVTAAAGSLLGWIRYAENPENPENPPRTVTPTPPRNYH